jgi:hypothetical protein
MKISFLQLRLKNKTPIIFVYQPKNHEHTVVRFALLSSFFFTPFAGRPKNA